MQRKIAVLFFSLCCLSQASIDSELPEAYENEFYAVKLVEHCPTIKDSVFSKIEGPAWGTVSADGTLSGTPKNSNVGVNAFTVSLQAGEKEVECAVTVWVNRHDLGSAARRLAATDKALQNLRRELKSLCTIDSSELIALGDRYPFLSKRWLLVEPYTCLPNPPTNLSDTILAEITVNVDSPYKGWVKIKNLVD